MRGKAYFFDNISNINELIKKNQEAEDRGFVPQSYKIIETVQLDDKLFSFFLNSMNNSYEFLKKRTSKLNVSIKGEYLCIAVENSHSATMILICTFQYNYPKFVAVLRRENYGKKIY